MTDSTKKNLFDICTKYQDILIIDVLNYLYRYLYINQEMTVTLKGETVHTGHVYGILNLICSLKDRFKGCAIVLALDGIDTDRREINSEYKAQRNHSVDVRVELSDIISMASLVDGVYTCFNSDREADDMLYSLSKKVSGLCDRNKIHKKIYLLTNDKDLFQAVQETEYTFVHNIRKFGTGSRWYTDAEIIGIQEVKDKFNGVSPRNLATYRAIVGDSSDNLKGYFRYRKVNAATIATNFDVFEDGLKSKEGITYENSWDTFLKPILKEYNILWSNYQIMKLKDSEFDLDRVEVDVTKVADIIVKYQLRNYATKVRRFNRKIGESLTHYGY